VHRARGTAGARVGAHGRSLDGGDERNLGDSHFDVCVSVTCGRMECGRVDARALDPSKWELFTVAR